MDDRQLHWVQTNARRRPDRSSLAGAVARDVLKGLGRGAPAWRTQLLSVLLEELGPEFLDQAEPVSMTRGVLRFQVADAALAYHLRLEYEQRLVQLLRARLPQAGVNSIKFVTNAM